MKKILLGATLVAMNIGVYAETISRVEPNLPEKVLVSYGEDVYVENCAGCHKLDGSGVGKVFPNLKSVDHNIVDIVVNGKGGMPTFKVLSNLDLAAVISYVNSSFGNNRVFVQPEEIRLTKLLKTNNKIKTKRYGSGSFTGTFHTNGYRDNGTYTWENGTKFTGEYRKDIRYSGTMKWISGNNFVGTFWNNGENKNGTHTWVKDGKFDQSFKGSFRSDGSKKYGTYIWKSGTRFIGSYSKSGKKTGTYYYTDGSTSHMTNGNWD